jgi:hypothetical protein
MKIIENNLLAITNTIFKNRDDWKWVNNEQKEEFAFIVNRFFSKMYPTHASNMNHKNQDKVTLMNMWFYFQEGKSYPKWFWSKGEIWEKSEFSNKDFKLLMIKLNINKEEDMIYLIENHNNFIKEELKYIKSKTK